MGAASSIGETPENHTKYHCHQCHLEVFIPNGADIACPHCRSGFLEESMDHVVVPFQQQSSDNRLASESRSGSSSSTSHVPSSQNNGGMTLDQSRRLANAAIMLRILEAQLRDELDHLQTNFRSQQNEEKKKVGLTKCMKVSMISIKTDNELINDQPSCPICNEDYTIDEELKKLPCGHCYHGECVLPWLEMKRTCPICRSELVDTVPTIEQLTCRSEHELNEYFEEYDISSPKGADTIKDKAEVLYDYLNNDKIEREKEFEAENSSSSSSSSSSLPLGGASNSNYSTNREAASNALMRLGAALSASSLDDRRSENNRYSSSNSSSGISGGRFLALRPNSLLSAMRSNLHDDDDDDEDNDNNNNSRNRNNNNIRGFPIGRTFIITSSGDVSEPSSNRISGDNDDLD